MAKHIITVEQVKGDNLILLNKFQMEVAQCYALIDRLDSLDHAEDKCIYSNGAVWIEHTTPADALVSGCYFPPRFTEETLSLIDSIGE